MPNMTLSIPEALHREMNVHSDVRWSDVARQAFEKKVRELHWMDSVLKKSKLTEKNVDIVGHQIKAEILKRFKR